ncbi:MAG: carboxypeptidase M32, partial [Pseudomonadota bacterium]
TLGNVYAAQFFDKARKDIGDLDAMFEKGEFRPLLGWLRDRIHSQGSKYLPRELVRKVTGADPDPGHYLTYLSNKYGELYGL